METKDASPSLGNIVNNISGNNAPTLISIGSPGSIQNVNHQRKISRQARVEKIKRGDDFITRLILEQTQGIWDQGVKFELGVQMSGSYKKAKIIQGLPGMMTMVVMTGDSPENKEKGAYYFSTTSAPLPDQPIILEITSDKDINVVNCSVNPSA